MTSKNLRASPLEHLRILDRLLYRREYAELGRHGYVEVDVESIDLGERVNILRGLICRSLGQTHSV